MGRNGRMKLLTSTICVWWIFIAIIFTFPYLLISIQFDAGFNVSDWNEFHRFCYIKFVCILTALHLMAVALNELIKDKYNQR